MPFILGPKNPAFSFLQDVPRRFHVRRGTVVVAWARRVGVGLLHTALGDSLQHVDVVVGMAGRGTSAEALALLRAHARSVFVYHKHHRQTFHPKLYLLDDGGNPPADAALLVGSSNLTGGGLFQNIEGNLALHLRPSLRTRDANIYHSVIREVDGIVKTPYCEQLTTDDEIRELLEDKYISTERVLNQRREHDARSAAKGRQRRQRPEDPPPSLPDFRVPPLDVVFYEEAKETPVPEPAGIEAPPELADSLELFYVRTLTANDVNKLHGRTPGTAEWDIGETARDAMPEFWGWPDQYNRIQRTQERLEWSTSGVVRSSTTGDVGREVKVVLWYREPREGHAAEHRIRVGPRSVLVDAIPDDFDTTSLIVIERFPKVGEYTFLVQFLTGKDPGYADYAQYLRHERPQHWYGYGP